MGIFSDLYDPTQEEDADPSLHPVGDLAFPENIPFDLLHSGLQRVGFKLGSPAENIRQGLVNVTGAIAGGPAEGMEQIGNLPYSAAGLARKTGNYLLEPDSAPPAPEPSVMGATDPNKVDFPPVTPTPGFEVPDLPAAVMEKHQPIAMNGGAKPQTRAIRLPNGNVLFTNQDYGGDEMSVPDAGKLVRSQTMADQDRASISDTTRTASPQAVYGSPEIAMRSIVRASADQARARGEAPGFTPETKQAAGPTFSDRPGVSTPGTLDDTNREEKIRSLGDLTQLANAKNSLAFARLSPEQQALFGDKSIMAMQQIAKTYGPQLGEIQKSYQQEVAGFSTPGSPTYIEDPVKRRQEIANSTDRALQLRNSIIAMAQIPFGAVPTGFYRNQ